MQILANLINILCKRTKRQKLYPLSYGLCPNCYAARYRVPLSTGNWAKYVDRETIVKPLSLYKSRGVFTQQINSFNFKIHYKEKNYLKVKTIVFKYITPPIVKGSVYWHIGILVYCTPTFPHSYILSFTI